MATFHELFVEFDVFHGRLGHYKPTHVILFQLDSPKIRVYRENIINMLKFSDRMRQHSHKMLQEMLVISAIFRFNIVSVSHRQKIKYVPLRHLFVKFMRSQCKI